MALTVQAALAIALQCAPDLDPNLLVGIAKAESGLDPGAIHRNANGTRDWGLMQINSANFGWLGLTPESSLDPCRSMAAGAAVLKSLGAYNTGNGSRGIANGYAQRVMAAVHAVKADSPAASPASSEDEVMIEDRPAATDGETLFLGGQK
jgi:type IV secretion system protein VirB1